MASFNFAQHFVKMHQCYSEENHNTAPCTHQGLYINLWFSLVEFVCHRFAATYTVRYDVCVRATDADIY